MWGHVATGIALTQVALIAVAKAGLLPAIVAVTLPF